jgi:transposase
MFEFSGELRRRELPSRVPNMRFVPVKSAEQWAILSLHQVRQGFIEERTATINRIRGLLAEFGMALPQRADQVRRCERYLRER